MGRRSQAIDKIAYNLQEVGRMKITCLTNPNVVMFNGLGNQIGQLSLYLFLKNSGLDPKFIYIRNQPLQAQLKSIFELRPDSFNKSIMMYCVSRIAVSSSVNLSKLKILISRFPITLKFEPKDYAFDKNAILQSATCKCSIFFGGWHNSKLHDLVIKDLRSMIKPCPFDLPQEYLTLRASERLVVGIHIRGGDYLSGDAKVNFGGISTSDYYKRSLNFVADNNTNFELLVFTNDENLAEEIIDWDIPYKICKGSDIQQFYAMMSCDGLIISNSSFSYWAARLSTTLSFVLRPEKFSTYSVSDVYPDNWIRV